MSVGSSVELDAGHVGDSDKVDVMSQEARTLPPSDRSDHAIDESAWGDAVLPAPAIDADRTVEVHDRIEPAKVESQHQPTEVALTTLVTRANEYLHDDGLGDRDGALVNDEFGQSLIDGTFGNV